MGTDTGVLTYAGTIEAFGGTGPSGNGGDGLLTLIAPNDGPNLDIQAGALFNSVTPLSPDSDSVFMTSMSLSDYLPPHGGAGGGGGGGAGLVAETIPYVAACCFSDGSCDEIDAETCVNAGGNAQAEGTTCAATACPQAIPTLPEWGLIVMTLLVLTAGTIVFVRRGRPAAA